MPADEKTMKTERIYEGRIINLRVDTVELPEKKYSKREIIEHPGAVSIVALTEDKQIVLVRQFRKAVEEVLLELPAGKIEKDEDPQLAALRELEEETGYKANQIHKLIEIYTTPGFTNEVMHIYFAENVIKGSACPDEDEYIETVVLPLDDVLDKIKKGEIKDSKTIIGILLFKK